MAEKINNREETSALRRRAEIKAALSPEKLAAMSPEETRRMLHELLVHQIELEMQNEELRQTQAELDTARTRYFDLYNHAPVGYCTLSEQGVILELNFTASSMLGLTGGASARISRFILKEDQDVYYLQRKQLFETGTPQTCELRMLKKDGTVFWAHLAATVARDANGDLVCRLTLDDVTERKQAETALRESEKKYSSLFNSMLEGFALHEIVCDAGGKPTDYRFLDVNPAFESLTGLKKADIIGKTVLTIMPETEYFWIENYGKVALTGEPVSFEHYSGTLKRHYQTMAFCPRKNQFAVIFNDITDRKFQEEAHELTSQLIVQVNTPNNFREHMSKLTASLQNWSGCEAVGIRLRDGDDYPYYETRGFPSEFVQLENCLCECDQNGEILRDSDGNPILECMCGNILCGRFDPAKPFFTAHGSFWSNNTTALLTSTTETDRQARTRNRCNGEGYESVALIPLRAGQQVFGLLQFNDHRPDCFTPQMIEHFEKIADNLAIALSQRQTEEALRLSEARFRSYFELPLEGRAISSPDSDWLDVNTALCEMLGYTKNELMQMTWTELTHPDDLEASLEQFNRVLDDEIDGYTMDRRFIHKDGHTVFTLVTAQCVRRPDRSVDYFMTVILDISDRKQAEEALRLSEARFRGYFELPLEGRAISSPDTRWLDVNDTLCEMLGYTRDELTRMKWADLSYPDDMADNLVQFNRVMNDEIDGYTLDKRFIHRDGHIVFTHLAVQCLRRPDRSVDSFMSVFLDISDRKRAELELKDALTEAQRFREALDHVPAYIFMKDTQFRYIYANRQTLEFIGCSAGELYSYDETRLLSADTAKQIREMDSRVLLGEKATEEVDAINSKGERRVYWEVKTPIFAEPDGKTIYGLLGISTDITDRKKSEEKLREINAYLENLINYANAPIIVWDPHFRITRFNHAFEFLTGRSEAEVIGQSLKILFPPALAAQSMALIRKTETGERWETVEIEIMHRDKSTRTVLWNSATLFAPDNQTPVATIAQGQDITDRKQAELELKDALAEAQRFREALDHVPAYVYMKDTQSRYTYANRQVLELFGCSSDEIAGFDDTRFFSPATAKQIQKMESGVFQGKHITGEMDTADKKGERHVYLEVKTPIFAEPDGKQIEGLLGIATDITDRKLAEEEIKLKNEELLKVNAEKNKFFSIIAHDLRSPFNSFLMLTKIMADGSPHLTMDGVREIAGGMRDSAANIFRLLENLLQWATVQQGLMPFNPQIVRLRPIVEESMAMALDSAQSKDIQISCDIPDGMEVYAESNMLQSVIRNLVSNAVKFTSKGGKITLSAKVADDEKVEIAVKDSGIGMNRAIMDNLFRLDVRTNRKGTASEPGAGLGLLLCKEFVEKHGGRIWVESKEEKGSVFYFTIPCKVELKEGNVIEEVVAADKKEIKAKRLKILIADDDEKSELMISLTVKKLGKEILRAKTGVEAVAACRNNPDLDLILMDIAMPKMDGYAAARQIRKFNKGVIIIAQTAYGLAGEREKAIAAGCNDYIAKPFRPAALTALLKKHF